MKTRLQRSLKIAEQVEGKLQVARQILLGKPGRGGRQFFPLRRRSRHQACVHSGNSRHQKIAEITCQLTAEMLQVLAVTFQFIDHFQHAARIVFRQRLGDFFQRLERKSAQQRAHLGGIQFGAAAGNRLIQRRKRVAYAAFTGRGQNSQHFGVGLDAFLLADPRHARHQVFEIHGAETEVLAARSDGRRNLVRLGSAEHEYGPWRRLFNRLEQRVKGFVGDLVSFVDDKNLVPVARRLIAHIFAQLPHVIDAAVAGRVDLDHIHGAAGGDFQAAGADATGFCGGPLNAIQAARQNAGDGGLASAALARKNIPVGDPVLGNGVFERGLDVFLVDHVVEGLRPVLAGDYLVHGVGLRRAHGQVCQAPGNPRHTNRTTTVASFRTWRGLQPSVARSPRPDKTLS